MLVHNVERGQGGAVAGLLLSCCCCKSTPKACQERETYDDAVAIAQTMLSWGGDDDADAPVSARAVLLPLRLRTGTNTTHKGIADAATTTKDTLLYCQVSKAHRPHCESLVISRLTFAGLSKSQSRLGALLRSKEDGNDALLG